jgi:hypothetical protein
MATAPTAGGSLGLSCRLAPITRIRVYAPIPGRSLLASALTIRPVTAHYAYSAIDYTLTPPAAQRDWNYGRVQYGGVDRRDINIRLSTPWGYAEVGRIQRMFAAHGTTHLPLSFILPKIMMSSRYLHKICMIIRYYDSDAFIYLI